LYHWRIYGVGPRPFGSEKMIASEPLPHFVDDLLGYLRETHPQAANLAGVHATTSWNMSRQAIAAGTMRWRLPPRLGEISAKRALTRSGLRRIAC
jgi:hypothetical protein